MRIWRFRRLITKSYFQEHLNFYGRDDKHGPIIMSIKVETGQYRVIIRCLDGNFERYFGINDMGTFFDVVFLIDSGAKCESISNPKWFLKSLTL